MIWLTVLPVFTHVTKIFLFHSRLRFSRSSSLLLSIVQHFIGSVSVFYTTLYHRCPPSVLCRNRRIMSWKQGNTNQLLSSSLRCRSSPNSLFILHNHFCISCPSIPCLLRTSIWWQIEYGTYYFMHFQADMPFTHCNVPKVASGLWQSL